MVYKIKFIKFAVFYKFIKLKDFAYSNLSLIKMQFFLEKKFIANPVDPSKYNKLVINHIFLQ